MPKKRRRKQISKFDGKFMSLQAKLRTTSNLAATISDVKLKYHYDEIRKYFTWLVSDPRYLNLVCGIPFPQKLSNLYTSQLLAYSDFDKEIFWTACVLRLYAKELSNFVRIRQSYENKLLLGEYSEADSRLKEIEERFGQSIWLLENKIALIQQWRGIEEQKKYTQSIVSDESLSGVVKYLAFYISVRAENNVSCTRFDSIMARQLEELRKAPPWIPEYIKFKLNFFKQPKFSHLTHLINLESNSSLVDRYITFVRICQLALSNSSLSSIVAVNRAISLLQGMIEDIALDNLGWCTGTADNLHRDERYSEILRVLDNYTDGEYGQCAATVEDLLGKTPLITELLEIYVKSIVRLGQQDVAVHEGTILHRVLSGMLDVLLKNERTIESFHSVLKQAYVFGSNSWAPIIVAFLFKEFYSCFREKDNTLTQLGRLSSHLHNPKLGLLIDNLDDRKRFYDELEKIYPDSHTLALHRILSGLENDAISQISALGITNTRQIKYEAEMLINKGEHGQAVMLYKNLLDQSDLLCHQDAIVGQMECWLKSESVRECMDLASSTYIENSNLYGKLRVGEILRLVENNDERDLYDDISLPIVYDIYSRHYGLDKETNKAYAFEDFLNALDLYRPSELRNFLDHYDKQKLIYYLRYICIPQVMDWSINFNSTEEVENERIKICQLLSELDPADGDKYSEEIRDITQRQLIRKEIQKIEQSKIYVDVEGIKNTVGISLEDSFQRYMALPNIKISEDAIISLRQVFGQEVPILLVQGSEKLGAFHSIFFELRDMFVSSNEYGLDSYLSVRIRHGTLSGQLRSPLESEHLITQKDTIKGKYQKNEYWEQLYSHIQTPIMEAIGDSLSNFSKDIDNLIDMLKNIWIQIKTEDKNPDGMFDFTSNIIELLELQARITETTEYESLVNLIIEYLWEVTDHNLDHIRNEISTNLKQHFNEAFDKLQVGINVKKSGYNLEELDASVARARTIIQDQLDKVAAWFSRTESSESPDYDIKLPIEIAITMLNNAYPNQQIIPDIDIREPCILQGKTLKGFVDIFYILLDNIVKHCDVEPWPPHVKVSCVKCVKNYECLQIRIENELKKSSNVLQRSQELQITRDKLAKAKALDSIRKEGGSGFSKTQKILTFDLRCPNSSIEFYISKEGWFVTQIEIPIGELLN